MTLTAEIGKLLAEPVSRRSPDWETSGVSQNCCPAFDFANRKPLAPSARISSVSCVSGVEVGGTTYYVFEFDMKRYLPLIGINSGSGTVILSNPKR
jgi:hypothetical protein